MLPLNPRKPSKRLAGIGVNMLILVNKKIKFWLLSGTMQTLDARNFELFLHEDYQDGSWDYTQIGSHETKKHLDGASGAIFDMKHLKDASTAGNNITWKSSYTLGY